MPSNVLLRGADQTLGRFLCATRDEGDRQTKDKRSASAIRRAGAIIRIAMAFAACARHDRFRMLRTSASAKRSDATFEASSPVWISFAGAT
jgi:hypothetical protein